MFGITPYHNDRGMYNPFRELERMEQALFSGNDGLSTFRTDIRDNGDAYLLEAELPGFRKEDIHLDLSESVLTISAERHSESEEKDGKGNVIHSERSYGRFERRFDLSGVNEAEITAEYTDGVLKLTLPKKSALPPETRRLQIR